jgi:hypothetical protein
VLNVPVRNFQLLAQWKFNGGQKGLQQRKIIFGDPRQDSVGKGQIELIQCGCSVP